MKQNSVLVAQVVGLFVILAAMFGIDVSPEQQAQIIAGLSAFGLVFTSVIHTFQKYQKEKKDEINRIN